MLNTPEGEQFTYFNEELGKECKAVKWEEETEYCIYDYCTEEETCTEMRDWENSEAYRKYKIGGDEKEKKGRDGKRGKNSGYDTPVAPLDNTNTNSTNNN
jgi:hypothetical protein